MAIYCIVSGIVGVKFMEEKAPTIGYYIELATGCKVIGNVAIEDDAIVGLALLL